MLAPRLILTFVVGLLGMVLAFVPENTTQPYKLTATELLDEVRSGSEVISPDELAQWLVEQDPSIRLIDVRNPSDYEAYHLPEAINIPLDVILTEQFEAYFDQDIKMNILYSNGTVAAQQAWMILRQLGYENNYVLQGGLNYWTETIMNPQAPSNLSPNEEIARYSFRKGASQALGGASVQSTSITTDQAKSAKPPLIRRKKKKAPEGGC